MNTRRVVSRGTGRRKERGRFFAYIAMAVLALIPVRVANADSKQLSRLEWKDLKVKVETPNPMTELSAEQIAALRMIIQVRQREKDKYRPPSEYMVNKAKENTDALQKDGIDVDDFLARLNAYLQRRNETATAMVKELQGVRFCMSGYPVPLEYDEKRVVEFLLVPWAGACIHTPPPPVNQIVHVKISKGFIMTSISDPITVTGTMTDTEKHRERLYVTDGHMNVSFGYKMAAENVEKYKADNND